MVRKLPLFLVVAALWGCSSSSEDALEQAQDLDAQADAQLAQGQVSAAHGTYQKALAALDSDVHANAGAAVTGLLLLPDAKPVTDVLDTCGQPHFDVEHQVFGASGVLAQAALARSGSAAVTFSVQPSAGAAFQSVPFTAQHVRSKIYSTTSTSPNEIYVQARSDDAGNPNAPQSIELWFDVDDVNPYDGVATPLTDGTIIDLGQLPSFPIYLETSGEYFSGSSTPSGKIIFHGSATSSSAVRIEFQQVQMISCSSGTCDQVVQVDGEIDSTLVPPIQIPKELRPFGTIATLFSPVYRPQDVGYVDACGATMSTDVLTQKLADFGPILEEIHGQLDSVIAAGAGAASFTLPKGLLHTREDLVLSASDLQAVRALVNLGQAFVLVGTHYRYLQTPLAQLVGDQQEWIYGSNGLALTPAHDFLDSPLTDDLNANFLAPTGTVDSDALRTALDQALSDAAAVLTAPASTGSTLQLQSPHWASLSTQLAEQVKALRASLGGFQISPHNPGYGANLQAFVNAPPDRQSILANAGLTHLFTYVPANADAGTNDRIDAAYPPDPPALQQWSGDIVVLPADGSGITCIGDGDCPAGNTCAMTGACVANYYYAWDSAADSDAASVGVNGALSPAGQDLLDLLDQ